MDILHLETMSTKVAVLFFSIFPYVRFHGQIRGAVVHPAAEPAKDEHSVQAAV